MLGETPLDPLPSQVFVMYTRIGVPIGPTFMNPELAYPWLA